MKFWRRSAGRSATPSLGCWSIQVCGVSHSVFSSLLGRQEQPRGDLHERAPLYVQQRIMGIGFVLVALWAAAEGWCCFVEAIPAPPSLRSSVERIYGGGDVAGQEFPFYVQSANVRCRLPAI